MATASDDCAAVDDRHARVVLSCSVDPGDPRVAALVGELGAERVLDYLDTDIDVWQWEPGLAQDVDRLDPAEILNIAADQGIRFVVPGDAEWPTELGALRNAGVLHERGGEPLGLWVRGAHDLQRLTSNSVAVVGSRAATSYGTELATDLSRDLATMGHTVISGLSYGIDHAAHRGALLAGGPTIAVLPGGVNRPYPVAHTQLFEAIAEHGLIVSEAPPGATPNRSRFLARNRVIAGLAEGTVVVEGSTRSGALNAADWNHQPAPAAHGRSGPGH